MTLQNVWKILHVLALFLYVGGLGGVLVPLYSGWRQRDVRFQSAAFQQAARSETSVLLPGILLTGLTGVFWAASEGFNYIHDVWLLILAGLYLFNVFVCLPLMGAGLRRARVCLRCKQPSPARSAMRCVSIAGTDNVPMVFGTAMAVLLPVMAWLAIFKP